MHLTTIQPSKQQTKKKIVIEAHAMLQRVFRAIKSSCADGTINIIRDKKRFVIFKSLKIIRERFRHVEMSILVIVENVTTRNIKSGSNRLDCHSWKSDGA